MVSYFIDIIRALVKVNIMAQLIYQVVNIYFKITHTIYFLLANFFKINYL